jgi:hypothetical protein
VSVVRRGIGALLFRVAVCSASVSLAHGARGSEVESGSPTTVAIACARDDRFGLRLVAEFEALGLRAVVVEAGEPLSRVSLKDVARQAGAIAAIRTVPLEHGAEVWIADGVTGKVVIRDMASGQDTPDREAALALRVVELLRASLLEASLPAAPRGEVPLTPEIETELQVPIEGEPSVSPPPTLRLSLAPGVLVSPGGFSPTASLDIGVTWTPYELVGLTVFAAVPLMSASVTRSEGSVDLSVALVGGGLRVFLNSSSSRFRPIADLGVAAVWLRTVDIANVGFASSAPSATTAAPFARVGLTWALTPVFRMRADVLASAVVQGVSIEAAGREIATWGRPIVLSCVGVDFGWF